MTTVRLKLVLKDFSVVKLWRTWAHNNIVNSVVKRCIRDRGVREVIQRFKYAILRPRRTIFLSATAAYQNKDESDFSCEQGISDEELKGLMADLESVKNLAQMTVYCTSCGKRLMIDKKQNSVHYCGCNNSKPAKDSFDGWVPYMESDDVIIWRKEYKPGQGLFAYKVYGRYSEIFASDFAAVQVDGAYRRAWDTAVASLAVVQRNAQGVTGQSVLHWEVLWPRLFANRDYVYIRRHKEYDTPSKQTQKTVEASPKAYDGTSVHSKAKRKSLESYAKVDKTVKDKLYIIISKSCVHPDVPETKHAIRVSEYWSHMVVQTLDGVDKVGMEYVLTYYDEPAVGGMPGGVAAWASSRAAPVYLQRMRKASVEYRSWASQHHPELPDFTPFGPDQVTEVSTMNIKEQDMESSKEGPDIENGVSTKDQSTQTDSNHVTQETSTDNKDVECKKICDVDYKKSEHVIESCVDNTKENAVDPDGDKEKHASAENIENKKPAEDNGEEKISDKAEDDGKTSTDINNEAETAVSWWRYLYPFYYFAW